VGGDTAGRRSTTARGARRAVQKDARSHEERVGRCGWECRLRSTVGWGVGRRGARLLASPGASTAWHALVHDEGAPGTTRPGARRGRGMASARGWYPGAALPGRVGWRGPRPAQPPGAVAARVQGRAKRRGGRGRPGGCDRAGTRRGGVQKGGVGRSIAAAVGDGTRVGRGAAQLLGLLGAGKERRTGGAARQGRRAAGSAGGAPGTGARAGSRGWWGEEEGRRLRGPAAGEGSRRLGGRRRLGAGRRLGAVAGGCSGRKT
jgi:hypothetical protein